MSIGPYAECAQYHPLLRALDRAATAPRLFAALASGRGNLDPHTIDEDNRRRGRKGPLLERLHVLGHTRHHAVTGGKREYLAQGQGHRLWQIPQPVPQTIAHHVRVQKRPPAVLVARDALPV